MQLRINASVADSPGKTTGADVKIGKIDYVKQRVRGIPRGSLDFVVTGDNGRYQHEEYGASPTTLTDYHGRVVMTPDEVSTLFSLMVSKSDLPREFKKIANAVIREVKNSVSD